MPRHLQNFALAVALLAVAAFLVSFATGIRGGGGIPATPPGETPPVRLRTPRVRVEVLNAGGRAGLAREATRRLRDQGFDVVYFGNNRGFGGDTSLVIDRVGRAETAGEVAEAIGIARVESDLDPSLLLEVTVVLGRDWPPESPAAEEGQGERGWFGALARRLRPGS